MRKSLAIIIACGLLFALPAGINEVLRVSGRGTLHLLTLPARGLKAFGTAWLEAFALTMGRGRLKEIRRLNQELARVNVENLTLSTKIQTLQDPAVLYGEGGLPAKIIQRDAASWSSTLWINVGERDNEKAGQMIVARHSPVLAGNNLVGVVEEVKPRKSRVRLLTDSALCPSVRVARGNPQKRQCLAHVDMIVATLLASQDRWFSSEELEVILQNLGVVRLRLSTPSATLFLAKGELHGSSQPLWRSLGSQLTGTGFNYDFGDEHGPARDLRTGSPIPPDEKYPPTPLIQEQDLLVTTGMDGIFPPGLSVAVVAHLQPLREGSTFFEFTATPTAGDLNALENVRVISPLDPLSSASPGATPRKG